MLAMISLVILYRVAVRLADAQSMEMPPISNAQTLNALNYLEGATGTVYKYMRAQSNVAVQMKYVVTEIPG